MSLLGVVTQSERGVRQIESTKEKETKKEGNFSLDEYALRAVEEGRIGRSGINCEPFITSGSDDRGVVVSV